jgi:MFS transporter, FLVCR family, MFS-domain-containing protein 7
VVTSDRVTEFWIFFAGQSLTGVVMPFIGLNVVTLFAVNWFGEKERTLAGTIAVLANIVGPSLAFGIAPAVVTHGSEIPTFLLAQAGICTACAFGIIFVYVERPPSPPSSTAEDDAALAAASGGNFKQFVADLRVRPIFIDFIRLSALSRCLSLQECFRQKWFIVLLIGYGLGYGSLQSFITLINQISIPEGYTSDQAGFFGVAVVLASIVGALAVGAILDKTRKYVFVIRVVGVAALISFTALTFLLRPERFGLIIGICCILGASAVALVPACLEAAVEVTFPVAEATPTGLLSTHARLTFLCRVLIAFIICRHDWHCSICGRNCYHEQAARSRGTVQNGERHVFQFGTFCCWRRFLARFQW